MMDWPLLRRVHNVWEVSQSFPSLSASPLLACVSYNSWRQSLSPSIIFPSYIRQCPPNFKMQPLIRQSIIYCKIGILFSDEYKNIFWFWSILRFDWLSTERSIHLRFLQKIQTYFSNEIHFPFLGPCCSVIWREQELIKENIVNMKESTHLMPSYYVSSSWCKIRDDCFRVTGTGNGHGWRKHMSDHMLLLKYLQNTEECVNAMQMSALPWN